MKQVIIFLIGLLSILVALAGAVCAVVAVVNGGFALVCGFIFFAVWVFLWLTYMKNKYPEKIGERLYAKFK